MVVAKPFVERLAQLLMVMLQESYRRQLVQSCVAMRDLGSFLVGGPLWWLPSLYGGKSCSNERLLQLAKDILRAEVAVLWVLDPCGETHTGCGLEG